MQISESPKILPFTWPHGIEAGLTVVSINCIAKGGSPLHFRWIKDGHEIASTGRISIRSDAEFSSLEIRRLEAADRGNYSCLVSNAVGSDSFTAALDIKRETCPVSCRLTDSVEQNRACEIRAGAV